MRLSLLCFGGPRGLVDPCSCMGQSVCIEDQNPEFVVWEEGPTSVKAPRFVLANSVGQWGGHRSDVDVCGSPQPSRLTIVDCQSRWLGATLAFDVDVRSVWPECHEFHPGELG